MQQRSGWLARFAEARQWSALWAVAGLLAVFLAISFLVQSDQVQSADQTFTTAIQSFRSNSADSLAAAVTVLGNGSFLMTAALASALFLLLLSRPVASIMTLVSLAGLPLNWLVKEMIGRPRPDEGLVSVLLPAVGLSFPSGHATMAVLFYGFLAFLAWVHIPFRRLRIAVTAALATVSVAIGASRVYLGVHWLSDVLGGWTMGLFLLLLLSEGYRFAGARELGRGSDAV